MTGLQIRHGQTPLIVSFPHTGTQIPDAIEKRLVSPWLARKDTDWWVRRLYDFAEALDATMIATDMSRTVIDVNRDPSGASLYPGQATTGLCPLTTFDGEPLYKAGREPSDAQIVQRRRRYFDPYHDALTGEIDRLHVRHGKVVLYDAHSIRSSVPLLFDGMLPHFNLGTDNGRTCAPELIASLETICAGSGLTSVTNGRFRGGWTTRHYGNPSAGIHTVQMELACRTYMDEPPGQARPANWPTDFDAARAVKARAVLTDILKACLHFATS